MLKTIYSRHENVSLVEEEFGVYPPPPIPETLADLLFDKREGGCFALLDAARLKYLPETLGASDLKHVCLFQGEAKEELADVAPWLVELAPDSRFTRRLLSSPGTPLGLWEHDATVFLRSHDSLDTLRSHFRRMTRLYDASTQRWLFFRFYASPTMRDLVAGMGKEKLHRLCGPAHRFIVPDGDEKVIVIDRPERDEPDATL